MSHRIDPPSLKLKVAVAAAATMIVLSVVFVSAKTGRPPYGERSLVEDAKTDKELQELLERVEKVL